MSLVAPTEIGADQILDLCRSGPFGAIHKTVDRLLSSNIPLEAAYELVNTINQHIDPVTDAILYQSSEWLRCDNGCARPLDDDFQEFVAESTPLPVFQSFEADSSNEFHYEAILSLTKILTTVLRFATPRNQIGLNVRDRLAGFAERICRVTDLENISPALKGWTPITCGVIDLILSILVCTNSVIERIGINPNTIQIPDDEYCYAPKSILQNSRRLRKFKWGDKDLSLSLDLVTLQPVPELVPLEIRNKELLTYLSLFRSCMKLYLKSFGKFEATSPNKGTSSGLLFNTTSLFTHYYSTEEESDENVIPGWKLQWIYKISEPPNRETRPLVFVSFRKSDPCQLAVGIRGTLTGWEWIVNFKYWVYPLAGAHHSSGVHRGYLQIVNTFIAPLTASLKTHSRTHSCKCNNTKIIVYGHSLGGGIGQILAYKLGLLYKNCVRMDGVFFASPRVITGTTEFATLVNTRHLIDLSDPLHYFPCYAENSRSGHPRCPTSLMTPPGHGRDRFEEAPGKIMVRCIPHRQISDQLDVTNAQSFRGDHSNAKFSLPGGIPLSFIQLPMRLLYPGMPPPRRDDVLVAHFSSFACALSVACHGLPWSEFRWWCDHGKTNSTVAKNQI